MAANVSVLAATSQSAEPESPRQASPTASATSDTTSVDLEAEAAGDERRQDAEDGEAERRQHAEEPDARRGSA